jgi:hypothetical protein
MLTSSVYPFITKEGSLSSFKTTDTDSYNTDFQYGDTITGSNYQLTATLSSEYFLSGEPVSGHPKSHLLALKNTFDYYKYLSPHYAFNSSLGNKRTQECRLISIPSIFYGKSIKKGSISCKWYVTGTLMAELRDIRRNGELIEVYGPNTGSVAGVALYSEGFALLTGSWELDNSYVDNFNIFEPVTTYAPKWIHFLTTGSEGDNIVPSSSFDFSFDGIEEIPTITMFAHAEKGEFNHSNNPTYVEYGQQYLKATGSIQFLENSENSIKNIVQVNYNEIEPPFEKTTFISKIGIYDEMGQLIGIAKLSTPVRKREIDSIAFKLKLNM